MAKLTIETNFFELIKELQNKMDDIPYLVANEIVNTVQDRFREKTYNDSPWLKTSRNSNTLIKSGDMRQSVRIQKATEDEIIVEIATAYAAIHNEGGQIRITDKMRSYFWSQYYKTNDEYWKGLALHKTDYIDIPKRQMIGSDDRQMIENIETLLKKLIED